MLRLKTPVGKDMAAVTDSKSKLVLIVECVRSLRVTRLVNLANLRKDKGQFRRRISAARIRSQVTEKVLSLIE